MIKEKELCTKTEQPIASSSTENTVRKLFSKFKKCNVSEIITEVNPSKSIQSHLNDETNVVAFENVAFEDDLELQKNAESNVSNVASNIVNLKKKDQLDQSLEENSTKNIKRINNINSFEFCNSTLKKTDSCNILYKNPVECSIFKPDSNLTAKQSLCQYISSLDAKIQFIIHKLDLIANEKLITEETKKLKSAPELISSMSIGLKTSPSINLKEPISSNRPITFPSTFAIDNSISKDVFKKNTNISKSISIPSSKEDTQNLLSIKQVKTKMLYNSYIEKKNTKSLWKIKADETTTKLNSKGRDQKHTKIKSSPFVKASKNKNEKMKKWTAHNLPYKATKYGSNSNTNEGYSQDPNMFTDISNSTLISINTVLNTSSKSVSSFSINSSNTNTKEKMPFNGLHRS